MMPGLVRARIALDQQPQGFGRLPLVGTRIEIHTASNAFCTDFGAPAMGARRSSQQQ